MDCTNEEKEMIRSFKKEWEEKIRDNPRKYLPISDREVIDPSKILLEFSSDDNILKVLRGEKRDWCCSLKEALPGGDWFCVIPPGASPNNMCG